MEREISAGQPEKPIAASRAERSAIGNAHPGLPSGWAPAIGSRVRRLESETRLADVAQPLPRILLEARRSSATDAGGPAPGARSSPVLA